MIEIMVIKKYEGQNNFVDLIKFLDDCGFIIFNVNPICREWNGYFTIPENLDYGHSTEYDFTFVHKNALMGVKNEN